MVKQIIKLLLKYPVKIANRVYVNSFYKNSPKRERYEIDNIVNLPDKVLVFSPHVDDETIGLGATLLKSKRIGAQMALVYMTDGGGSTSDMSRQKLIAERQREGHIVKKSYGFQSMYFLDEPDGKLNSRKDELVDKIVDILNKEKPSVVFTPFLIDGHRDHVETTKSVIRALERWNETFNRIYMYEVNCAIDPRLISSLTYMDNVLYNKKGNMYDIFKSQWAMGFDAFRLMDRAKRFLAEDEEKAYGVEAFVRADVETGKSLVELLESEGFKPDEFKQLSSDYNVILSFTINKDRKNKISNRVNQILNDKNE